MMPTSGMVILLLLLYIHYLMFEDAPHNLLRMFWKCFWTWSEMEKCHTEGEISFCHCVT
jgi:hypothetical protein